METTARDPTRAPSARGSRRPNPAPPSAAVTCRCRAAPRSPARRRFRPVRLQADGRAPRIRARARSAVRRARPRCDHRLLWRLLLASAWASGPSATVDSGYSLLFRIDTWDAAHAWEYQVVYGPGSMQQSTYG